MNARTMIWARSAAFAAAALTAASAFAGESEGPRYTYVELGYERVNPDHIDDDLNAGSVNGSLAVTDHVHLFAGYSYGEVDTAGTTLDVQSAEGGAGLNFPLTKKVDVVADAAYLWSKVHADRFGSADDNGYGLSLGLRAMVTPKLELNGGASFSDTSGTEWSGYVGGAYSFTRVFAVTVDVAA